MKRILVFLAVAATFAGFAQQNDLNLPEESPRALVSQRIGVTDITVSYHSPQVKGRKIWGAQVPFGEVWRAGANENTAITFSSAVTIDGKKLPAGTYGLHMIPTEKEWTIILSRNYYSWGSYFYKQEEDALRFTVTAQNVDMQDWLDYSFEEIRNNSVFLAMRWEKVKVSFKISIDLAETVVEDLRKQLNGLPGFFPDAYYQAAAFCIRNNFNQKESLTWLDHSIELQPGFENLSLKASLLKKEGKTAESDAMMKKALGMANETGLNSYGYQLLSQGKSAEAITIFKENVKKHPDSWNAYDSLAEALEMAGDKKGAIANYKSAKSLAPADQQKRIENTLKRLETK